MSRGTVKGETAPISFQGTKICGKAFKNSLNLLGNIVPKKEGKLNKIAW
jgi:hypothetical protein